MAPKKGKHPVVEPLPNNGTVQVVWGDKGENVFDYQLISIHYSCNEKTGVATCTLNDPKSLNSLTPNQIWEYFLIMRHAERDSKVKVLVWTGRGRAFSSGADLAGKGPKLTLPKDAMKWFMSKGYSPGGSNPKNPDFALRSLVLAFWDFKKPSVCAVNGLAVGGSANIALMNCHDLVIGSTEAKFKYPFAKIGFTPELGSSALMAMSVGPTRAKQMMLLGDWFDAHQAKEMGLLLEVTTPEQLMPRALEMAGRLAKQNPATLSAIKEVMNCHVREHLGRIIDVENEYFNKALARMMGGGKPKPKL